MLVGSQTDVQTVKEWLRAGSVNRPTKHVVLDTDGSAWWTTSWFIPDLVNTPEKRVFLPAFYRSLFN